jgi:hypothetical protein
MFVPEELLILLLQFVFELLFDILVWFPWDIFLWWREDKTPPGLRLSDNWLVPLAGVVLGGILGGLSLVVVPTTILRHEAARLLNLVATPLLSGSLARALSKRRVRSGRSSDPRLHFWFAFAFSIMFLVVRFTWAHRAGDLIDP